MVGVCFRREINLAEQDQWSLLFSNFGVTEIWERDKVDPLDQRLFRQNQHTVAIDTANELPDVPLIVLSPLDQRYAEHLQGEEPLDTFVHPEDAIYLFGGTAVNLNHEDLGGREPDHLIYIPSVKYAMYPHIAAYITLYDRYLKVGDFG